MLLAVDVDYRDSKAFISGVSFESWKDSRPKEIFHSVLESFKDYEPGEFYLREMPCILQLLNEYRLVPDMIIIDGYVYLGEVSNPGLGMHLYNALGGKIPIIGVAKKPFKGTSDKCEIFRGRSKRPLYITNIGIDLDKAKAYILSMHGKHRLPTLLKDVDRECRQS